MVLTAQGECQPLKNMPFPPYCVKEALLCPPQKIIDNGVQLDLFEAAPFVVERVLLIRFREHCYANVTLSG